MSDDHELAQRAHRAEEEILELKEQLYFAKCTIAMLKKMNQIQEDAIFKAKEFDPATDRPPANANED